MKLLRLLSAFGVGLVLVPSSQAALYWEAGTQSKKPTLCFVGDASISRPARVSAIKDILAQYEQAGNVRFQYQDACTSNGTASKDNFTADIRIVIPWTAYGSINNVFNQLNPIPGIGCTFKGDGGGWSWEPNTRDTRRECLFNLHLGDDNYAAVGGGDPSGGATPFLNHTLHEVGHALGLAHEHARKDVNKDWVLTFIKQIPGVSDTQAKAIYAAGYRSVASIRGPDPDDANTSQKQIDDQVTALQNISGYSDKEDADALRLAAYKAIKDKTVQAAGYGGSATSYMTPYDPKSVMHYSWLPLYDYAPGNYANTGLSKYDRLAIHILYPEDDRVAELAGCRVLRQGETLRLHLVLALRGAIVTKVLKNIVWTVDGIVKSNGDSLVMAMPLPGSQKLSLSYTDLLGRSFAYDTSIVVLTAAEYRRRISAPLAAQGALL